MGADVSSQWRRDRLQVRQLNGAVPSQKASADQLSVFEPVSAEKDSGDSDAVKRDSFRDMKHLQLATSQENTYHNYQSYLEEDLPTVVGNAAKYYVTGGSGSLEKFQRDSGNDQGYSSERSPDEDEDNFQKMFREQAESGAELLRNGTAETVPASSVVVAELLAALECATHSCRHSHPDERPLSAPANSAAAKSRLWTSQRTGETGGDDTGEEDKRERDGWTGKRGAKVVEGTRPTFITTESTFEVKITKTSQGLGLSVTGGTESDDPWAGMIRVKKVYPLQPAWQTGQLHTGDILLSANGVTLTGLSSHEALEVLRTTPTETVLLVCHPPEGALCDPESLLYETSVSTTSLPLSGSGDNTTKASQPAHLLSSQNLLTLPITSVSCGGEFEVTLSKVNGSLGFTLRKYDDSILGHYVRALVKEPAISDGRIQPGDKIIAVNEEDISAMSHSEAVNFLRNCPDTVTIRLYRDSSQTPVSPMSPTETDKHFRPKPLLRKEAMDMLSDLATKKSSPAGSPSVDRVRQLSGTPGSPRRRRLTKTPSPDIRAVAADRFGAQDSVGVESMSSEVTPVMPSRDLELKLNQVDDFTLAASESEGSTPAGTPDSDQKPKRPTYLDLCNGSCSKKQKFMFSSPSDGPQSLPVMGTCGSPVEPDINCEGGGTKDNPDSGPVRTSNFSHNQPEYQSANLPLINKNSGVGSALPVATSDQDIPTKVFGQKEGMQGLLKWKGIVFTPDQEEDKNSVSDSNADLSEKDSSKDELEDQVITIELHRGWSSRLGFSVQEEGEKIYINTIYADSVAAKDGRLQVGDQVMKVNNECVEGKRKDEVIDMLRKTRGTVIVTIRRKAMAPGT